MIGVRRIGGAAPGGSWTSRCMAKRLSQNAIAPGNHAKRQADPGPCERNAGASGLPCSDCFASES